MMKRTIIQYALPVVAMLILSCIIFYPQLQNKQYPASDIIEYQGMSHETREYYEQTGEHTWWSNSMFGGMPTYQIVASKQGNLMKYVEEVIRLFIQRPIGYFFMIMICAYIGLCLLGCSPWVSAFGAVVVSLSVSNFVLFSTGHMTKLRVLALSAPILIGGYLALDRQKWIGVALYGLALGLALYANHPQMLYYTLLSLLIYGIISLIAAIKENRLIEFSRVLGGLIVVTILALATSASNLLPTQEYTKDTMRGEPILTSSATAGQSESSVIDGLDWQYATNWSNGFIDLVAGLIPGAAGGSSAHVPPRNSVTEKNLRSRGYQGQDLKLPLYWGGMYSTGAAFYFGASLLFLFGMFLALGQRRLAVWLGLTVLVMLVMSMGRNAAWFNRLLFDYFPYFNKFRTPNSISPVIAVIISIGAALGLYYSLREALDEKRFRKVLFYVGGVILAICAFYVLIAPGVLSFTHESDSRLSQMGINLDDIIADRKMMMRQDGLRSMLIISALIFALWLYMKRRLKPHLLILVVTLISLFDVIGIGRRYLSNDDFVPSRMIESEYTPRQIDQQILNAEPNRGSYRVLDQSINTYNSAKTSYFHNTIGGYHPAKLQRFEDIKNRYLAKGDMKVINMLNGKYIISPQGQLQQNSRAFGPAWLVDNIHMVNSADEEINAIDQVDPSNTAIIHQTFANEVDGLDPDANGQITLSSYSPNHLTYTSETSGDALAVFSEIWYGPDKGWSAQIDGAPVDILRANYFLRALRVPAGQHEIEFFFQPESVARGKIISLISSAILLLLCGYIIYRYSKKDQEDTHQSNLDPAPGWSPVVASSSRDKRMIRKQTKRSK